MKLHLFPASSIARPSLALVALALLAAVGTSQLALVREGKESRGLPEPGDDFGYALASGDFDGDGYLDVACAAPFETTGAGDVENGAVIVNFGGPFGLTWQGAELLLPTDHFFVSSDDTAWFGFALAAGDFDGDGLADLAVGAPLMDWAGVTDTGAVCIYLGGAGTSGTLQGQVPVVYDQSLFGAAVEAGDRFGAALHAGPLNGDAFDDLLIGGPGENQGSGAIYGAYGTNSIPLPDPALTLPGTAVGAAGGIGDAFGSSVLFANVVGGPEPDLIVGAPFEDFGLVSNTGAAYVIPMNFGTPQTGLSTRMDAASWGYAHLGGARFGSALAAGDFQLDGDAQLDLAVGGPGEAIGSGRVYLSDGGPAIGYDLAFTQGLADDGVDPKTDAELAEAGDAFGSALVTCDHDGDGLDDLVVGAPGDTVLDGALVFHAQSGTLNVFYGDPLGLGASRADAYTELNLSTAPSTGAALGQALAAGDDDDDPGDNVFVGSPGWNVSSGQYFDLAPWRQVYGLIANSALAGGCDEQIYYALRPFDPERTASTGKIMTTLLGCEAAQLPVGDPDRVPLGTNYVVPQWLDDAFVVTGCSAFDFAGGEQVTFETLMRLTVMLSANDATYGVADLVADDIAGWIDSEATAPQFVALMNQRAAELGMTDTTFGNPSGIDTPNQWSTTYDMWLLTKAAMQNPLFQDFVGTNVYAYDRLLPSGAVQPTVLTYPWLNGMQGAFPDAVGVKPGSTSVDTRVGAARHPSTPWGTHYALVYGVPKLADSVTGWSFATLHTVKLLELGQALCDPGSATPVFPTPSDFTVPTTVEDLDLAAAGDSVEIKFDLTSRSIGPLDDPTQQQFDLDAVFDAPGAVKLEIELDAAALLRSGPGESQKMGVHEYEEHLGIRVANPDPALGLQLTILASHPPGAAWDTVLAPGGELLIPADSSGDGTLPFVLTVVNQNPTERQIQVDALYGWRPIVDDFNGELHFLLEIAPAVLRSRADVSVRAATDPASIGELALTLRDPSDPFVWDPCGAEWRAYGAGWPGELGVPPLSLGGPPTLGNATKISLGSSSSTTVPGALLAGPAPLQLATGFGGELLVAFGVILNVSVPSAGLSVPLVLPLNPNLCGAKLFLQHVLFDPQASHGLSFSRGVELEFGY